MKIEKYGKPNLIKQISQLFKKKKGWGTMVFEDQTPYCGEEL